MAQMEHKIGHDWVNKAVTFYADDIHCGTIFYTEHELYIALTRMGCLLDVLEEHGLTISLQKSFLLLAIGGTNCRRVQTKVVQRSETGLFVIIPRADGCHTRLPVKNVATYLGVQMSYHIPEQLTLQYRMQMTKTTMHRLRQWLNARRLTMRTKMRLWTSCIYPTLTYGLLASNITFQGLFKLHTFIMSSLRKVAGNHSFQTGMTHAQFLHCYGLQHPFAMLLRTATQLRQLQCQRLTTVSTIDILHTIDWSNLQGMIDLIHAAWQSQDQQMDQRIPETLEEVPIQYFACQWCRLRFTSLPNLRRHQTHVHGYTQLRTRHAQAAAHALHGLPICTHCHQSFTTWRRLCIHLERQCCQASCSTEPGLPIRSAQDKSCFTNADLALLLSKPYGRQLLQLVEQSEWAQLRTLTEAHQDLQHHCILCGVYFGRIQELNMHLRCHHGRHAEHVFAKAAQLGKAQASITPCFFCTKRFARQHQCPFWTQISLLLVNLPMTGTLADCADVVLRCEVCREQFEDGQTLHNHLFQVHKLEIHDWVPTRDLLEADPVCSHCLACFTSKSEVRHHITRGLCSGFNVAKPLEEMPVAQRWQQLITAGDLAQLPHEPMQKLALTLHCQLCGVRFERQCDLALHLQTVHTSRWTQSQTQVHLLLQIGQLYTACICNPQTTSRGVTHICPAYRQLSMLAQRVDHDLFLPWTFDDAKIRAFLAGVQQHAVTDVIVSILINRQFADLWNTVSVCQLLSTTCLLCGGTFHLAVLCEHVKAQHVYNCTWIPEILPQLLPAFCTDVHNDFQCQFCGLVYNLPATTDLTVEQKEQRDHLVQIHAQHHCPVLYQIGLLLTHCLPSRDGGSADGRRRNLGGFQGDGTPSDERTVHQRQTGRKRTKKTQTPPRSGSPPDSTRGSNTGSAHGQHAAEDGFRAAVDEKTRLLRLLSANCHPGPTSTADDESLGMAPNDEAEGHTGLGGHPVCPTTCSPLSGPGDHAGRSSSTALQGNSTGSPVVHSQSTWTDHGGGPIPVPEMVHTSESSQGDQAGLHPHAADAEVHGSTEDHLQRSLGHHEIPCTSTSGGTNHSPVDPADGGTIRRTPISAGGIARLDGVGTHWSSHETSHTGLQQAGTPTTEHAWQGQGQADQPHTWERARQNQDALSTRRDVAHHLRTCLTRLILINLDNWCYANTAVITWLWAVMSCHTFTTDELGPHGSQIVQFLLTSIVQSMHLPSCPWFARILEHWHGDGEECDPVEFLTHMDKGLQPPGMNWTWERRVQIGTEYSVRDDNGKENPVTLYIDPELAHAGWIRLDSLIDVWHNYLGMQTAFMHASPVICFHIDRHVLAGTGEPCKSDLSIGMHGVFTIPFFTGQNLAIEWKEYKVVAAIAHLGDDQSGHCRAILRMQADYSNPAQPVMHLLTNDNGPPEACWKEPDWFVQNVMCIWMCAVDVLSLHSRE